MKYMKLYDILLSVASDLATPSQLFLAVAVAHLWLTTK